MTSDGPEHRETDAEDARARIEPPAYNRWEETAYRSMVESTTDSIYLVDRECRYLFVNSRHLMSRINLSKEEVIGRRYGDFHTPDKAAAFAAAVDKVFNEGVSIQEEHRSHRDGRYFLRTFSPVRRDGDGTQIVAVNVVSKDITKLKLTENSLRNKDMLCREYLNSIERMVFLKDDQSRYLMVNNAFLKFFSVKEEGVIGKKDNDFIDKETAGKLRKAFEKVMSSTGHTLQEVVLKGVSCQLRTFPIELPENKIGLGGLIRDITDKIRTEKERRKLENQLLQSQKMEAIGTLAGGIAHDFNNLLMGIQGYASLMLFDVDENHRFYKKLKGIEKQVQNGADLTKQLLSFARSGNFEVRPANINEIVGRTAAMFSRTKKEITINENYQPNLWTVEVDRGQMEQVLMNLYVNAWQAMPEGGCLYLETQNVELDDNYVQTYDVDQGRYVNIMVADTGVGMDESVRARLFEPFFTTKEMGRGTGLGLAAVYGIIRAHRGFINVYSEKGMGTVFKIYLPASDKKAKKVRIAQQDLLGGTETLLIVDDEASIIDVTKEILENLGYRVFAAKSGKEAIDIYEKNKDDISLVILDMIMPGMGGGETFDELKKINPHVAVILSSGYSLNHQASSIMKKGCRTFMQKPFRTDELSHIVRQILSTRGK